MKITELKPDPLVCPLCGKPNACINLGALDIKKSCWCNDPAITFPEELLSRIPPEQRRKACVCRNCVVSFQSERESE